MGDGIKVLGYYLYKKTTCTKLPVQLGQYTYEEVRILSHKKMNRKDRALDCMSDFLKKTKPVFCGAKAH